MAVKSEPWMEQRCRVSVLKQDKRSQLLCTHRLEFKNISFGLESGAIGLDPRIDSLAATECQSATTEAQA